MPIFIFEASDFFRYDEETRIKYAQSNIYMYLTMLSALRLVMLQKVAGSVYLIVDFLKKRETKKIIFIENCKSIVFAVYKTIYLIHVGACIWIYIKFYEERVDTQFLVADKLMRTKV